MRHWCLMLMVCVSLCGTSAVLAADDSLERLLRAQAFNKEFEGFDFYHVMIESDEPQSNGSREVTAVASGRFREHIQRLKVLFLIVGDRVIGGQILEKEGLPPCNSEVDSTGRFL